MKSARGYGLTDNDFEGMTIALPKITFSEKMEIDLGGQTVILIYPGSSHTDGSVMVYITSRTRSYCLPAIFCLRIIIRILWMEI